MKKIYVVSYHFRNSADDYPDFFDALQDFDSWWHFIQGTWLITTDLGAKEIYEKLNPSIDDEVNLLIVEAGPDLAGRLPTKAWNWIKSHQPQGVASAAH
jgi:hypothetical protein